jgi:6-phosphogluconolactonase (cycloisomerase 2 family)
VTRTARPRPNNLTDATRFLFVVNAGSNSISVFQVNQDDAANGRKDALRLVTVQPSGGEKPVSLTVNAGSSTCFTAARPSTARSPRLTARRATSPRSPASA